MRSTSLPARALVVFVIADQLARDAVAVEQDACPPRVLTSDNVGLAQGCQHAQRDVLEVADRRRANDQPAGHACAPIRGIRRTALNL